MSRRLHITNGDAAADVIGQTGIGGEVLSWSDVLHEGPVLAGLRLKALSSVRAQFITDAGWGDATEIAETFGRRDQLLQGYNSFDEIVLWFEHDLYDQLQLLQVMDFFAGEHRSDIRLSMICDAEYLGRSLPEQLATRFEERGPVGTGQLNLAQKAWAAFRSPSPTQIQEVITSETDELPFLASALTRHLEQFPSTDKGLSRSERQILEIVTGGETVLKNVFRLSAEMEEAEFLGDAAFAMYVERLSEVPNPLLVFMDGGERIRAPRSPDFDPSFWSRSVHLTPEGTKVLQGDLDHVQLNGIDRYLGGVRVRTDNLWRWNTEKCTVGCSGL